MIIKTLWLAYPARWVRGVNLLLWLLLPILSVSVCHNASSACATLPLLSSYVDFYLSLYVLSALSGYLPLVCYLLLALLTGEIMARLCQPVAANQNAR